MASIRRSSAFSLLSQMSALLAGGCLEGCGKESHATPDAAMADAAIVLRDASSGTPIDAYVATSDAGGTSTGNCGWETILGSGGSDQLTDVVALADGTVIAVGQAGRGDGDLAGAGGDGMGGAWAVRLDASGHAMWHHTYGKGALPKQAILTADGDVAMVGYTTGAAGSTACASPRGGEDVWLAQIDVATGAPRFVTCLGGAGDDRGLALREYDGPAGRGFHVTGSTESRANGDIGDSHGTGGVPDMLSALYVTPAGMTTAMQVGVGLGSRGPEAGFAFLANGAIVGTTFGDMSGDLVEEPLLGFQDAWVASWPDGFCEARTCTATPPLAARFGGNFNDTPVAATAAGIVVGWTGSDSGDLQCAGATTSNHKVWISRLDTSGALTGLRCIATSMSQDPTDMVEARGALYVVGTGASTDGDFASSELVGSGTALAEGFLIVFDPETLLPTRTVRTRGSAGNGVAVRPDGCVVTVTRATGSGSDGRILTIPPR